MCMILWGRLNGPVSRFLAGVRKAACRQLFGELGDKESKFPSCFGDQCKSVSAESALEKKYNLPLASGKKISAPRVKFAQNLGQEGWTDAFIIFAAARRLLRAIDPH